MSVCLCVVLVSSVVHLLVDPDNMVNASSASAVCVSAVKRSTNHEVSLSVFLSSFSMLLNQNSSNRLTYNHTVHFATLYSHFGRLTSPNSQGWSACVVCCAMH